jgi:hypothetical protein
MNTASENFELHCGVLRDKLHHPTDYEKALYYFLEEFAGDVEFVTRSLEDEAPPKRN